MEKVVVTLVVIQLNDVSIGSFPWPEATFLTMKVHTTLYSTQFSFNSLKLLSGKKKHLNKWKPHDS